MQGLQDKVLSRLSWGLTAISAALGAVVLARSNPYGLLVATWPLAGCLGLLATATLGCTCTLENTYGRALFAPAAASLRLSAVLLTIALWRGEAREFLGALAIWIAWHDAEEGLSETRPLLPAAVALAISLGWSSYRTGPPAARAVAVGVIAGWAAARGARSRINRKAG